MTSATSSGWPRRSEGDAQRDPLLHFDADIACLDRARCDDTHCNAKPAELVSGSAAVAARQRCVAAGMWGQRDMRPSTPRFVGKRG